MLVKLVEDVKIQFHKTAKGGYSSAEINYDGAKKPFKLVSFKNPAVFETFKNAKAGEAFDVNSEKGEDGFYSWTSAKKAEGDVAPTSDKKTWVPGADPRETKEERAARQRLIVRQSSLANAIQVATDKEDVDAILETAERFTAWVYQAPGLDEMENDIPF